MSNKLQLPAGWKSKPIFDVAPIKGKLVNPKLDEYSKLILIAPDHIQQKSGQIIAKKTATEQTAISGKFLVQKGEVIYSKIRPYLMKAAIAPERCLCSADMYPLHCNDEIEPRYLHSILLSDRFTFYANSCSARTGIPKLNREDMGGYVVTFPPPSEQKAIADLLSTWDKAIEKTERLIQTKEFCLKGQIQRIMGKDAIDENGWSMVHLGDLFSEVTRKVGEKELTPYSISARIGFVSQREKWGKDISGSQHKNYTHLKAGEFSYNKGNSKRYQQGCVYLLKDGEICVPNVFISFKPKAKNVVPEFFEHYFIADYHARELKRYITSGARSDGLLNLNKKDFFKIMVPCPSPDEQKAIAEALTAQQQEINLLKQLAEKYKTQKRGLMQRLLTGEWRVRGFAE